MWIPVTPSEVWGRPIYVCGSLIIFFIDGKSSVPTHPKHLFVFLGFESNTGVVAQHADVNRDGGKVQIGM